MWFVNEQASPALEHFHRGDEPIDNDIDADADGAEKLEGGTQQDPGRVGRRGYRWQRQGYRQGYRQNPFQQR